MTRSFQTSIVDAYSNSYLLSVHPLSMWFWNIISCFIIQLFSNFYPLSVRFYPLSTWNHFFLSLNIGLLSSYINVLNCLKMIRSKLLFFLFSFLLLCKLLPGGEVVRALERSIIDWLIGWVIDWLMLNRSGGEVVRALKRSQSIDWLGDRLIDWLMINRSGGKVVRTLERSQSIDFSGKMELDKNTKVTNCNFKFWISIFTITITMKIV